MKYLEEFNWFKKKDKPLKLKAVSKDILMDICLELEDLGISISIDDGHYTKEIGVIHIGGIKNLIDIKFEGILWKDMKDCIFRIIEYLGNNYLNLWYRNHDREIIDVDEKSEKNIKINDNENIYEMHIYYAT